MIGGVTFAMRPSLRESVTLPSNVARDPFDGLVDAACVINVPRPQSDKSIEGRPVHLRNIGNHRDRRDVILGTLVYRDRDDIARGTGVVSDVSVRDLEIRVAVLHIVAADRLLIRGQYIGILKGRGLDHRK